MDFRDWKALVLPPGNLRFLETNESGTLQGLLQMKSEIALRFPVDILNRYIHHKVA